MTTIYVLELADKCYYVGKSQNVEARFIEHMNGTASMWTKIHRPIKIEKVVKDASDFDEDKYVKEYMFKYGCNKVRGGTYVNKNLSTAQMETLKTEIWSAKDLCTKCGRNNHFVKDCVARRDIYGNEIYTVVWCCEYCDREFDSEKKCIMHEKNCKSSKKKENKCFRCKRPGHYANKCYARTDAYGNDLSDSDSSDY